MLVARLGCCHASKTMKRIFRIVGALVLLLAGFIYLNNADWLTSAPEGRAILLAHRGLAQTFDLDGVTNDTCTATRIHPPTHPYLENTIASMEASFLAGADLVEFDIHPTTDGRFAVFHDWTVDCRTEGKGVTREHSLAQLKALDVGYGYTADSGKTFPFRGKGVGLMPSLDEVLSVFPDRRFLIHIKSNDPHEGDQLASHIAALPPAQRGNLIVYGGTLPIERVRQRLPDMRTMSRASLTQCLLRYIAIGWSGYIPAACHHSLVLVPINVAPWLWNWPDGLLNRMARADSIVVVVGPYSSGEFSRGIDSEAEFARLPRGFAGSIWTNRIDRIGALVRARH
jgi:glycerophosphoryl diester phosphodiesterase